jgi:hypothetical protein
MTSLLERSERSSRCALNVTDLVEPLVNHGLYQRLSTPNALKIFMESHVFCVWDFQSLLKSLQRALTCVNVPWFPTSDPSTRRLINEIVLDEESDELPDGRYLSHFELYLEAMDECGADSRPIRGLIDGLKHGTGIAEALSATKLPRGVREFVDNTLEIANCGQVHRVAASFTYGRENVLPSMFMGIVENLALASDSWSRFVLYLRRHIEHDGERHGPLARIMVERLCGDDERLWREAEETARSCLAQRLNLWDRIAERL